MSTSTTRLGLVKPATTENYDVTVVNANADKVDNGVGALSVTSGTRPATPFPGQLIWETDTSRLMWWNSTGATWVPVAIAGTLVDAKGDLVVGTANDALARLAVAGNNRVLLADSTQATGLRWANAGLGLIAGQDISHANALTTTSGTTEVAIAQMTTNAVGIAALRRVRVSARWKAVNSVANDVFVMRIRETNTAGALVAEKPFAPTIAAIGWQDELVGIFENTTTGALTRTFVFTCARATGTGTMAFSGAGGTVRLGVYADDIGPATVVSLTLA